LTVVCVHMSHLTYGSPLHFRALNELLHHRGFAGEATVIGGDMNNWGWPLIAQVRGFRRAVRRRTWPAWRPHSQLDHLLVSDQVTVEAASVGPDLGSDHLPVRATLSLPTPGTPPTAEEHP
jgi:endonuclease/exonuclease/phosphatase family metal-dependent hydrolase